MAESEPSSSDKFNILLVDDEVNVLASLRRLLRQKSYIIHTAESALKGLEILENEPIDLVLSDMRMPVMDGAVFLEKVAVQWPDTIRILLTGHSDLSATVNAVARGRIYKYISKPWEDSDLLLTIQHALDRKHLEAERQRLAKLTLKQNTELKELNQKLEQKVRDKTEELQKALEKLESNHKILKKNYFSTIHVFSQLIEIREGRFAGHARRVADLARKIARYMDLTVHDVQNTFLASLLHGIGKIALPDNLIDRPLSSLTEQEDQEFREYVIVGERVLDELEHLREVSRIIRHQLEKYDGTGFPDGLARGDIPVGSRILAVASDYELMRKGILNGEKMGHRSAINAIVSQSGKAYDPEVVKSLKALPVEVAYPEKLG